jgi:hypothetical protein
VTCILTSDRSVIPPPASPPWPRALAFPRKGVRLVREEDAAAFVVDVAVMLKLSGRDPVITAENERWLFWLGALMLDRFGIGTTTTAGSTEADHV